MPELPDLTTILDGDCVIRDREKLLDYSKDHSMVTPIRPKCVVMPKNAQEVQEIVAWANKTLTTLVPVSSGPPHFLGATIPSVGGAVVVDFSLMKKIIRIDPVNRVVLVEPGVTFNELDSELRKNGLSAYMPLCPRSSKSVLGSALEREPITTPNQHWDSLDPLLCLEVIFGSGDKFRTGDASGPDTIEEQWEMGRGQLGPFTPSQFNPTRLMAGSQGTIGLATWGSFKCRALSEESQVAIVPSESIDPLIEIYYKIVRAKLGNHSFILNAVNLANMVGKDVDEIEELKRDLPPWALVISFEGSGELPSEKVAYQKADFEDLVDSLHSNELKPMEVIPDMCIETMSELLNRPSKETFWKLKYKGDCQDIFFLTTLDNTPVFINEMKELCSQQRFPAENMGVYLQMTAQGTSCHCEFNLYYDSKIETEANRSEWLVCKGSNRLVRKGAFFSRPYGPWAKMAYAQAAETVNLQRRVKDIFDPNRILNSGKLCF